MQFLAVISLVTGLSLLPLSALAEADGATLYRNCVACHGDTGQGNAAVGAPAIASQGAAYLERQLKHFKSGVRGADARDTQGAQMRAMAGTLGDAEIVIVANYLAAMPTPLPATVQEGDLRNGNNYYQSKCGACHGGQAEGNPGLNSPGLAWLDAGYLKHQFRNFQQGIRGAHPDDTYGRQMKMMSTSLPTDKDLDDVIAYIQSLAGSR
ncbi:MAG: c-type cytochrome [Halioglobus sp.]